MQAYLATRISPNISRTPEGFLIATAPIARSGWQDYRRDEIDRASNDPSVVRVFRPVSEVTSRATLASGEGKPIVSPHPPTFVSPVNWSWTAKGHVQNVRVGPRDKNGNVTLLADLHIHDGGLISKIAAGTRDLSCGYTYDLLTQSDGSFAMRNIRLNHVAVVEQGRAGTTQIMDSKGTAMTTDDRELLAQIASGIAELIARYSNEEEPEEELAPESAECVADSAEDTRCRRALNGLRTLRPIIEQSGDRRAVDAYNDAVRDIKRRMRGRVALDNAWPRGVDLEDPDVAWETMMRRFHRQNPQDVLRKPTSKRTGRAQDGSPEKQEWFETHREAGQKMREKRW